MIVNIQRLLTYHQIGDTMIDVDHLVVQLLNATQSIVDYGFGRSILPSSKSLLGPVFRSPGLPGNSQFDEDRLTNIQLRSNGQIECLVHWTPTNAVSRTTVGPWDELEEEEGEEYWNIHKYSDKRKRPDRRRSYRVHWEPTNEISSTLTGVSWKTHRLIKEAIIQKYGKKRWRHFLQKSTCTEASLAWGKVPKFLSYS